MYGLPAYGYLTQMQQPYQAYGLPGYGYRPQPLPAERRREAALTLIIIGAVALLMFGSGAVVLAIADNTTSGGVTTTAPVAAPPTTEAEPQTQPQDQGTNGPEGTQPFGEQPAGQPPAQTQPEQTQPEQTQPAQTQPAGPAVLLSDKGNGVKNTQQFTVDASWELRYSFDCSGMLNGTGNFTVTVQDEQNLPVEVAVNALDARGQDVTPLYQAGTFHLSVNSTCGWEITVVDVP
jgi:hypothetical protein